MSLKYDFLFMAIIFRAIIAFSKFKEFDKFSIVGKPRRSGIVQWKIFWKKKELKKQGFLSEHVNIVVA